MSNNEISKEEVDQYDRQIRLWGIEAQNRLRNANVLIIGMGGFGAEVTKNIVLAGINSIVLMDDKNVTMVDGSCQFLIDITKDIGRNRAECSVSRTKLLNPNVKVSFIAETIKNLSNDYLKKFDVICATTGSQEDITRLDETCRENGTVLFFGCVQGTFAYYFIDAGSHEYTKKTIKNQETTYSEDVQEFPKFSDVLETRNPSTLLIKALDFITGVKKPILMEFGVACAVIGGIVAQEIIKAISKKDPLYNNFFVFDSQGDGSGQFYKVLKEKYPCQKFD
ncbi:DgyrCDS7811 [Dimorphilus gyrociliatus]|uniref:DgyrCDS7811 n=1 Tax=Dimorphilus gyrociliatus TaxID=2664684 RepID=A0A7I8VUP8_9ANNE|nr:DgyrCDS7811 [Dimorphilus gyrociliatus]